MCAAVGEVAPPGCAHRVTIVVTTSPIPSHPSAALLKALFASFRDHLPGLEECGRLLVCDGYLRGDGKAQLCPEAAYAEYLDEVVLLAEGGALGPCRVLRLQERRGYSLALAAALEAVETEFVLVVQHDWLFVRPAEVAAAVAAMDLDAEVRYIGMQSMTTLDYPRRIRDRYGLELPPARVVGGLRLVPQLHWYDKPHLCRAAHYREVVFADVPMGVGECPERRYGQEHMWPRLQGAADLAEAHLRFGTFFWDVGAEVIYHLSGRKLRADESAAAPTQGVGAAVALSGEARGTATYTAVAAERVAVVPGLAQPKAPGETGHRFKGRCYLCGQKGHSKLLCPSRGRGGAAAAPHGALVGC